MSAIRKREDRGYRPWGAVQCTHLPLAESIAVRAKDCTCPRFCVENERTVRRGLCSDTGDDSFGFAPQSGQTPYFILAENSMVINFGPIRGEAGNNFVAVVAGESQRFAAGGEHDKYLGNTVDG